METSLFAFIIDKLCNLGRLKSWNEIVFLIFVKIYFNLSFKSDLLSTTNNFFYGIFVKYFPANPSKPSLLSACIEKLNADLH